MTIESNDYFTQFGIFNISPTKKLHGELAWQGEASYLYVGDDREIKDDDQSCITGYLHNLKKATLINCISRTGPASVSNQDEAFYHIRYFPHFIIIGDSYFNNNKKSIIEFSFVIEDFGVLFNDLYSFNIHSDKSDIVSGILEKIKPPYEVRVGERPLIAYFTGNFNLMEIATSLGLINVYHRPSYNSGGPNGVRIDNSIVISIKPEIPLDIFEAKDRIHDLLRFFEIVIGRAQKIKKIVLQAKDDSTQTSNFEMYWSLEPAHNRPEQVNKNSPSPYGVLLDPIRKQHEFKKVLINWLEVNEERRKARSRFSSSFGNGFFYTIDRLISAANMFDILPSSAVPKDEKLSADLSNAKKQCTELFLALNSSYERDSILGALGRVGKSSLKHKIKFRLNYITKTIGSQFEDIQLVADEAVNCRNYYVHGSKTKIDYEQAHFLSFFTDTLEFIFAASELIEAGWSLNSWLNKPSSLSHSFTRYKVNYAKDLSRLKKLLNPQDYL